MTKYIYHSEKTKTTCEQCKKHDGREFYNIKDIPELPIHPNCKCWIEVIEDKKNSNGACDCVDRLEVIQSNVNSVITNSKALIESVDKELLECAIILDKTEDINKKRKLEKIEEQFSYLKEDTKRFNKNCMDLSTDIESEKEFSLDYGYHTKEECKTSEGLKSLSKRTEKLCEEINDLSEEIKETKRKRRDLFKEIENKDKKEERLELSKGTVTGGAASTDSKNNNFEKEVENYMFQLRSSKTFIGKPLLFFKHSPDAAGMLNISEGKKVPLYIKDAVKILNIGDSKFEKFNNGDLLKWKKDFAKKIGGQFKPFGLTAENIEGYIFKNNSAVVSRIKQSDTFKAILKEQKTKILSGADFSGNLKPDNNLGNAFGLVDFMNKGFDKFGNLHLYMFDTYDFNPGENALVEAGRRLMINGELKGFFTIHEIVIPKEEIGKILELNK